MFINLEWEFDGKLPFREFLDFIEEMWGDLFMASKDKIYLN